MPAEYSLTVGLEIHAQLSTQSKIFCADEVAFGLEPNTSVSPISLAHPGTLPVFNAKALEYAVKMGLACGSAINRISLFDRKNYFYPDLPKGYQITQDTAPICLGGRLTVMNSKGESISVALNRIHLEEDAGKLIHEENSEYSLVDFNRAGTPLIEIVTEPVIESAEVAGLCLAEVRKLLRYLNIGDGNMEQGSLRCDANVSIRPRGSQNLGKKVEIKNMNSFRFVEKAIEYEFIRQSELLNTGKKVVSETRLFDPQKGQTYAMRSKESLNDYRYFPDPDLQPIELSEVELAKWKSELPVLPSEWREKFLRQYNLSASEVLFLTESTHMATYFEDLVQSGCPAKMVCNWIMGPVQAWLKENGKRIEQIELSLNTWKEALNLVLTNQISASSASSTLLPHLLANPEKNPFELAQHLNLIQRSDFEWLNQLVADVLKEMPEKVLEYQKGKKGLIGLFMGEIKKRSEGKADPQKCMELLRKALD